MKRKWKYVNQMAPDSYRDSNWLPIVIGMAIKKRQFIYCLLPVAYSLLFILSCNNRDEHRHISTNKSLDLDGLAKPANQTVFSEVSTISPIQKSITPALNATGLIAYDPRLINNISARFSGRIEKLYVRYNFENVTMGQRIMDIYSPEILTIQQNLIFLSNNQPIDETLLNSTKEKLQLLGLTDGQINQIISTRKTINPLPVFSQYQGHIHDIGINNSMNSTTTNSGMSSAMNNSPKNTAQIQIENLPSSQTSSLTIKEGMYVTNGQALFSVYNISKVWAVLNVFPRDAALIKVGDKVSITAETNPSNKIISTISYIEPITSENASAIKARVYLQNTESLHLKIGTLLSATISTLKINAIWLPRNAIVNLGQKQAVFIKSGNYFVAKTIQTGINTDSLVQVIGLTGDEQVAANAQFMVDSESFIKAENN